jgi:hypothetical protein
MAVVVVNQLDGADQNMYDAVNPKAMPDGQLPDGCQAHIAGPTAGGWRVITVWDSEEQFNEFRDGKLLPAIQEAGYADRIAPKIEANEVYNLITA